MPCTGNNADHCCWVSGAPCPFLEENTVEGRRWVCGLRRELGDWDAVLASDRYKTQVAPTLEPRGINCRDYPEALAGKWCATCGEGSR
jgi:hypothetical protein